MTRRLASTLVLPFAVVVACDSTPASSSGGAGGTDPSTTTQASSSAGRPNDSKVEATLPCPKGPVELDCVGSTITSRTLQAKAASFDCTMPSGRVTVAISEPQVGKASEWSATGRAFVGSACDIALPQATFEAGPGLPNLFELTTYEPGVYMEGTFANATGTFTGSFAIHDADGMP